MARLDDPLATPLCDLLGVGVPVLQAGMGLGARAELVAAVSNAGGLGVLGAAPLRPAALQEQITRLMNNEEIKQVLGPMLEKLKGLLPA